MSGLTIGPGVVLPLEAVTDTFAILANRGKGKSSTAHVLVEELHAAHLPVIVLDVKGDWYGLRTSADGTGPGLPFVVFGGDHADVPLEPTAGELLADLVVDERVPCVLDMSAMSKSKARSFTTAFAERLYRRNREALHVLVDEADVLIPQRASADTARLLGAMEDIAKRGRSRGLGLTLVTQRPQEVAKSVLDLCETLFLLGMTGPRSIKAIEDWISVNVDDTTSAATVIASLPTLSVGEAWVWSPSFLKLLTRTQVRRIHTFDSHATPKPGQRLTAPRGRAEIDLAALGERITATVERAKADDPKALRAQVAQLERDLAAERAKAPAVERVEVPVLAEDLVLRLEGVLGDLRKHGQQAVDVAQDMLDQLHKARARIAETPPAARAAAPTPSVAPILEKLHESVRTSRERRTAVPRPTALTGDIAPAQQRILDSLSWFASVGITPVDRTQLALFAGVSPKSSGYANNLGALRTAGLIDYPGKGTVALTDRGGATAEPAEHISTSTELQAALFARLPGAQVRILQALVDVYPDSLERTALAEIAGVSAASSGYANNLGALRSLGLLDYPASRQVAATSVLFLGGDR